MSSSMDQVRAVLLDISNRRQYTQDSQHHPMQRGTLCAIMFGRTPISSWALVQLAITLLEVLGLHMVYGKTA